ncbi:unnamed protein product [Didymodactylos carnosus]|uniref:F-box domain-containing protein n=1 Tax=Didymodactylos carnosus TaxID=1234261 RepID=A0A813WE30_9BILA|nr:unnamed protein product [Didymodactylos carnosus]CAF3637081.1 unnamed protein product [Didymodactylos carnosus]
MHKCENQLPIDTDEGDEKKELQLVIHRLIDTGAIWDLITSVKCYLFCSLRKVCSDERILGVLSTCYIKQENANNYQRCVKKVCSDERILGVLSTCYIKQENANNYQRCVNSKRMDNKKRKLDDMEAESNKSNTYPSNKLSISFDPSSIPSICYQFIFEFLPIESLISVSLTCKTWYNILSVNKLCYNKNTKLMLLNQNQLITISNSKILRHINKIEIGKYESGLSINTSINFQFNFTSLHFLKLCFISLTPIFIMNLFYCISQTLQTLILAIQHYSASNLNIELSNPITSCLFILSSLHLLPNLTHFFILVKSSAKIEFDIEKYFQHLTKLKKLIIRQDNYTCKISRIKQLNSIKLLSNLEHLEWFEILPNDLKILSTVPLPSRLEYINLEQTLITNEILYYLSKIPTINSLKSHRFSPIHSKLNINGFNYLLSLKDTLKELEISAKNIQYNGLMMIQYPGEADCTEDEYEVHLTQEHINILKQFVNLKNLSFNQININREDLDNLLISLAEYNNLTILSLEYVRFPSFTSISIINSLEELSLSHPYNNNREEYTDKDLFILYPLKKLKVLLLYYSMNLSKMIRKQLKEKTLKIPQDSLFCNLAFQQLEEFIYNDNNDDDDNGDDENDCEEEKVTINDE